VVGFLPGLQRMFTGLAVALLARLDVGVLYVCLTLFPSSVRFLCQAFVPRATFAPRVASTELAACRTNAKKEKIKRNRENMRKFKTGGGKKGISRRKLMKKALSSTARQSEAEFISKCFITVPPPVTPDESSNKRY
jgi:hypothetical protein